MSRSVLAASVCLLLSTSLLAGQPPAALPPNAPTSFDGTAKLQVRPSIDIVVGGVRIELEKTTLVQLQKTLGGTIVRSDDPAGEGTFGLCYLARTGDSRTRIWILSDEDMGADHAVDSAWARADLADQAAPPNCIEVKAPTFMKIENAEIGSSVSDVQAKLGKGRRQKSGWLGYSYNARAGRAVSQYLFLAIGPSEQGVHELYVAQTLMHPED